MKEKVLYGVGVIDKGYKTKKVSCHRDPGGKKKCVTTWECPFYVVWRCILRRCYCPRFLRRQPTYEGCSISKDWVYFSEFKKWMQEQDWQGKVIDKDFLIEGNKEYGPDSCIFISRELNAFLTDRGRCRGEHPLGVSFNKHVGKFQARCSVGGGKRVHLGSFDCPNEAHRAWQKAKIERAYIHLNSPDNKDQTIQRGIRRVIAKLIEDYENNRETLSL